MRIKVDAADDPHRVVMTRVCQPAFLVLAKSCGRSIPPHEDG
jgi:hypothetical protein